MELADSKLDDYLQQGIHGQKEINPAERKKFLGTLRERVVLALTQPQVREKDIYKEVEDAIKANPDATVLLNGNMNYTYLSKYIKLCNQHHVTNSIVTNKEHNSEIGLVVTMDFAVDKEEIYVSQTKIEYEVPQPKNKKGLSSLFGNLFKKKDN